ncbi:MAG TPA: 2-oxo-4-hydroxy-4-carboxy-5-ureidoimidazoline decarboxylase [Trichormus sp.]
MSMNVQSINELDQEVAYGVLLKCCGSETWARAMAQSRPFTGADDVAQRAAEAFEKMNHADWMQAFGAHPRIGDMASLRKKYENTAEWANAEQSGVKGTGDAILRGLAQGNDDYEKKYGHLFIVCATGKSAGEMLDILKERLKNDTKTEFANAAEEQKKITLLRLEKL